MKKFLSIFIALAMVLSLFAGVGARTAKADTSFMVTPSGNFVGGVNGSGIAAVDAAGTVYAVTIVAVGTPGTPVVTNVPVTLTQVGAGSWDTNNVSALYTVATSTDPDWATTGIQTITFATVTSAPVIGDKITVAGSSTNGVGTVLSISGTTAVVNVTTAVVGTIGPKVFKSATVATTDPKWTTAANLNTQQTVAIWNSGATFTLAVGDLLDVAMLQEVPATPATAFLVVSGTVTKGDVATVTWQDTVAASHTVSYTAALNDTPAIVATALSQLINALDVTTGNVNSENIGGGVIQLWQDVAGVAGNGKTLTATTTASVTPTLTIHTLGGLTQPGYVENGKTIQLVAVDATGATVSVTWTVASGTSATLSTTTSGLVMATPVATPITGVTVITATSGSATGVFAVIVVPVQVITSLKINLVPALPVSTTLQQFGAIASNAAYSQLDYTTQAVWTDALPVASILATTGLLTYSTDETGAVNAYAGGITATVSAKIATGVVTLVTVVGPVTKVIVLTIGSDIVTVDAKATTVDAAPEIVGGRTFVPIRFIAETFGSTVTWLPETKGVTIVLGDTTIGLQIGNATAVINGTIIALDAAPYIKNSRTMVPLRVISESFGGNVAWDAINHIITITYVLPVLPAA